MLYRFVYSATSLFGLIVFCSLSHNSTVFAASSDGWSSSTMADEERTGRGEPANDVPYEYEYNIYGEGLANDNAPLKSRLIGKTLGESAGIKLQKAEGRLDTQDAAAITDVGGAVAGIVCDGHGVDGALHARFAAERFNELVSKLRLEPSHIETGLKRAYADIEAELASLPPASGTTAVSFIALRSRQGFRQIFIAHVGDSRAVVATLPWSGKDRSSGMFSTADHSFANAKEVARYRQANRFEGQGPTEHTSNASLAKAAAAAQGSVAALLKSSPAPVRHTLEKKLLGERFVTSRASLSGLRPIEPGLTSLRALGHSRFKSLTPGAISAEPELAKFQLLGPNVVMLATKGLWDLVDSNEATALARQTYIDMQGSYSRKDIEDHIAVDLATMANVRAKAYGIVQDDMALMVRILKG